MPWRLAPASVAWVIEQEYDQAVPIDRLTEHPSNPRRGDVSVIADSIEANGFYGAVIAQRSTGFVVAGNHRLKAARESGLDTIPVVWVDVDDDRAKRILLVDNRSSDLARYDDPELAALLTSLAGSADALRGTGFADEDLNDVLARLNPPSLDDLAAIHGDKVTDDDMLITVTLRLDRATAADLNTAIQHSDGDDDSQRVRALLARAHAGVLDLAADA